MICIMVIWIVGILLGFTGWYGIRLYKNKNDTALEVFDRWIINQQYDADCDVIKLGIFLWPISIIVLSVLSIFYVIFWLIRTISMVIIFPLIDARTDKTGRGLTEDVLPVVIFGSIFWILSIPLISIGYIGYLTIKYVRGLGNQHRTEKEEKDKEDKS